MTGQPGEFLESTPPLPEVNGSTPIAPAPDELSFSEKCRGILGAAHEDYRESSNRLLNIVTGAGAIAMQSFDRARLSVVLVPTLAANVLESTQNPTLAALAAGVAFTGWNMAVGSSTVEGLAQYPTATKKLETNFPTAVDLFKSSLPGADTISAKQSQSWPGRIMRRCSVGVRRGLTVLGLGTTPYAVTAMISKGRAEGHKLNANASLDGGLMTGGLVLGAGELVTELAETHPALAQQIQEKATNPLLWYGVAGALIVGQTVGNLTKKYKRPAA